MRTWIPTNGLLLLLAACATPTPPPEAPPAAPPAKPANLVMYGVAKDMDSGDTLRNGTVRAFDMNDQAVEVPALVNDKGIYELFLMEERSWVVECSAPGREPKRVVVHLQGPPEEEWEGGFGMNTDFRLVERMPGVDLSLGLEPWGIARYDVAEENFVWDSLHTASVRERFRLLRAEAMGSQR